MVRVVRKNELPNSLFGYQELSGAASVQEIINAVKTQGDTAVREYSAKFGDGDIEVFEVTQEEIDNAFKLVSPDLINSLKVAIKNVQTFAQAQIKCLQPLETDINGIRLGHRVIPLQRAGVYVPGGNYPLPSSAIMGVVPAKVAGVKEVIVCSPRIKPATLVAASLAGADRVFKIGGVQAIAAMAYGTESVPKVDKIVGPGNRYVTMAKKEVYGVCGIDFLAGPSEVMIVADETANADFIAADMLAQAEHDLDARAYLITTSEKLCSDVQKKLEIHLKTLPTAPIASKAIEQSYIILADNIDEVVDLANKLAPEHLEICFSGCKKYADRFTNYGSLFIGNYSAEVFGDYCSGTNHVLPTNGVARYSGGLSVFDFVKVVTYQEISKTSAQTALGPAASKIAEAEGLMAHKLSADLRQAN